MALSAPWLLLSLASFWGKPPALLNQMEKELETHFVVQARLFLPGLSSVSIPVPLHSPGNRDVWLGGEKALRMILFGVVIFLNLLRVLPKRRGCLYSRDPDSAYPHLLSK